MGSIYMEYVVGVKNPRVGIVNIGAEEEKGNALVKETFPLLKACDDINFIGSIEAREFPYGAADVVVTEAFVGNVMLKLTEGLAKGLFGMIKKSMTATPLSTFGAALVKPQLKKTLKTFDATEYGGAPLLGLNGLVVKIHGNATNKEVKNALYQVETFRSQDINGKIKEFLLKDNG
jgi:glycerol-3-phosphate acyltransferase PlsX